MREPEFLRTYLDDHLALLQGALRLAERMRGQNKGTALDYFLGSLHGAFAEDATAVETLLTTLGGRPSRGKQLLARLAERIGRFKPNRRLLTYSPLSRVEELEGLRLMVLARVQLWAALAHLGLQEAVLQAADPVVRRNRAHEQAEQLIAHHQQALDQL